MNRHMQTIIFPIIGVVVGIAFIAVGLFVSSMAQDATFYSTSYGGDTTHLGHKEYGADFYSDSYEATAFCGNALKNIFDLLSFSIPAFFILAGLLTICVSCHAILSSQAAGAPKNEVPDQARRTDELGQADESTHDALAASPQEQSNNQVVQEQEKN